MVKQAGYHKAAELLFTAKKFNAETAVQAGLVNEIVEDAYATAQATAQHNNFTACFIKTNQSLNET